MGPPTRRDQHVLHPQHDERPATAARRVLQYSRTASWPSVRPALPVTHAGLHGPQGPFRDGALHPHPHPPLHDTACRWARGSRS
jgi:hypothetical protein